MSPLLTKPEIARVLGVSVKTITRLMRSRSIPVVRISPRCIRFNPVQVEAALSRMTQKEISL